MLGEGGNAMEKGLHRGRHLLRWRFPRWKLTLAHGGSLAGGCGGRLMRRVRGKSQSSREMREVVGKKKTTTMY